MDAFLIPHENQITAKGDGPIIDVSGESSRVFLLTLTILDMVEQEAIEVSVFGSPDGTAWQPKPLVAFPQKFYRGEHPYLLDLTAHPEVKFLRAHWEVMRWGRGSSRPSFDCQLNIRDVAPEMLQQQSKSAHR